MGLIQFLNMLLALNVILKCLEQCLAYYKYSADIYMHTVLLWIYFLVFSLISMVSFQEKKRLENKEYVSVLWDRIMRGFKFVSCFLWCSCWSEHTNIGNMMLSKFLNSLIFEGDVGWEERQLSRVYYYWSIKCWYGVSPEKAQRVTSP